MIKICLGALAAVLCLLLGVDNIINGVAISLAVYLVSDRFLKQIFIEKVEKQSVVTKTGIGIYIITWIFIWTLLYTLLYTPA
jgi:ABC-type uncharacterized transport system permease subunit